MHDHFAEVYLIAIAQHAWLFRCEALTIQMGAIGAAEVNDDERLVVAFNGRVNARDTILQRFVGCEIDVQRALARSIYPPDNDAVVWADD